MRRIALGRQLLRQDAGADPHATGAARPRMAGNAVAATSRMIASQGARTCLFSDRADPNSNRLIQPPGHRPVVDMAELMGR